MNKKGHFLLIVFAIAGLILATGLKFWIVRGGYVPFNSDEAIVALMARHILQGERPIFFYGQSYMGSLDAYLIALGFSVFGEHVWVIRLVQGILYLGVLLTTAWLGKKVFSSWRVGVIALILLAVPTVNVTLYTTASLGGYGEALLMGNLILILAVSILSSLRKSNQAGRFWQWFLLGFLIGLGLWVLELTLVFSIPVVLFISVEILRHVKLNLISKINSLEKRFQFTGIDKKKNPNKVINSKHLLLNTILLIIGFFTGSFPWLFHVKRNGFSTLFLGLSGTTGGIQSWILEVLQHINSFFLLGVSVIIGARPPWSVDWLSLPLIPFILIFWMSVIIYIISRLQKENQQKVFECLLIGVIFVLLVAFMLTSFGSDPSGRYFVVLSIPMALFAASFIEFIRTQINLWAYCLVLMLIIFHFWGTFQCVSRFPPGITTHFYAPTDVDHRYDDELITFLFQNNEFFGYTNYWVAYPLAFLSEEKLIFTPSLPYHQDFRYTTRDNRYATYRDQVEGADKTAYITTNHPALNLLIEEAFMNLGIDFKRTQIGDYTIYYALSRPIHPEEIGLGKDTLSQDNEYDH
jgi:hypothetical protein